MYVWYSICKTLYVLCVTRVFRASMSPQLMKPFERYVVCLYMYICILTDIAYMVRGSQDAFEVPPEHVTGVGRLTYHTIPYHTVHTRTYTYNVY